MLKKDHDKIKKFAKQQNILQQKLLKEAITPQQLEIKNYTCSDNWLFFITFIFVGFLFFV